MTNDYGNLELHKVLLSAMKDIDKICRENNLKYFLYAGTLLGAVNHKGFIPWDDDVDIVMFADDFKCFCEIIKKDYNNFYEMHTFDTDENCYSKLNKLFVKGTAVTTFHEKVHPIFVDIQVLHSIPDGKYQRLVQRKQIEFINLILSVQSGDIVATSAKSKLILGSLARINKSYWGKRLDKIMSRYDKKVTDSYGIMCNTLTCNPYTGATGYDNDITKRQWHENGIYIPFENIELMTFSNFEEDLIHRYGSHYMDPYPEEKRITKHDVKSYEISPEVRERVGL